MMCVQTKKLLFYTLVMSLMSYSCAWNDYTDYYDYDLLDIVNINSEIGSKVSLTCDNIKGVMWKHNSEIYIFSFPLPKNLEWTKEKYLEVTVNPDNVGIWTCWHSISNMPILVYKIMINSPTFEPPDVTRALELKSTTHISNTIAVETSTNPTLKQLKSEEKKANEELIGYLFMKAVDESLKNPYYRKTSTGSTMAPYTTILFITALANLSLKYTY